MTSAGNANLTSSNGLCFRRSSRYDARPTAERTEYQRVTLRREGRDLVAETTGSQSSSRLLSLAGAHALIRVPAGDQILKAGTIVEAMVLGLP